VLTVPTTILIHVVAAKFFSEERHKQKKKFIVAFPTAAFVVVGYGPLREAASAGYLLPAYTITALAATFAALSVLIGVVVLLPLLKRENKGLASALET
jgi:uncharacterized ion transporter superfamily protein YfcC